jgi:hypothetical protein
MGQRIVLLYNEAWKTDTGEKPARVFVVGDIPGKDASGVGLALFTTLLCSQNTN